MSERNCEECIWFTIDRDCTKWECAEVSRTQALAILERERWRDIDQEQPEESGYVQVFVPLTTRYLVETVWYEEGHPLKFGYERMKWWRPLPPAPEAKA